MGTKLRTKILWLAAIASFSMLTNRSAVAAEIQIYTTEEPPTNYSENGVLTGTTVDIVEALKSSLGVSTPISVVPSNRANQLVSENPNVLVFTFGRTPEREKLGYHFIGPVITRQHALWARKADGLKIANLDDVKNRDLTVGDQLGVWRVKFLQDAGVKVETSLNYEANLKKMMAGRLAFVASSSMEMPAVAKQAGVDLAELEPAFVFRELSSYLMFSKDTDNETLEKWQAAFAKLQATSFFADTAEKWSKSLGYRLAYASDKGFYAP